MKMSKIFVQTLREFPADAEVVSHKYLVRAGYIRKLTSGVYNYLPLMWRVLRKIENIIREELNSAGAQELLLPVVQPKELWDESGRWEAYGRELARFRDRHDREMCLSPTAEEVITAVARDGLKSYKQMPVNLYQFQEKFRDEVRPRFGLLRGREFIMKDGYSFDVDQEGLEKEYKNMADAYTRIFKRCGLETKMVQSDSGAIGGSVSHEFMVITTTDAGENDVFYCDGCDYSANSNHAVSKLPQADVDGSKFGYNETKVIDTPQTHSIEELCNFLNIPATIILKSLVYIVDKKPVIALIRADKEVEETKLLNAVGGMDIRIASAPEIEELMVEKGFNAARGFIGPKGMDGITIIADETVKEMKNFVVGINQEDKHMVGANLDVDIPHIEKFDDIRLAQAGEICPQCGQPLKVTRGIEVGNIFQLGTKYSKPMNAMFLDKNGKAQPYVMGCYGIGVTRTAAAAVERWHDEHGILWPIQIAPYHVCVVPLNDKDEQQMNVAKDIYEKLLNAGIEAVLDDRPERAGVKFKDADLIGFPFRITVGKTISEGQVELKTRQTDTTESVTPDEAVEKVITKIKEVL